MKFFSTYQKYRLILEPGQPGNRALGTPSKSATSLMFEQGVVDVNRPINGHSVEELIQMVKTHPDYGKDFIAEETDAGSIIGDPYADKRRETEPQHLVAEIKHGSVVGSTNAGRVVSTEKEKAFQKAVKEEALKLVQKMLAESSELKNAESSTANEAKVKEEFSFNQERNVTSPKLVAPEPIEDDEPEEPEDTTKTAGEIIKRRNEIASEEKVSEEVSNAIDEIIPEQEQEEDDKQNEEPVNKEEVNKRNNKRNTASKKDK
jgi:hypothetical protein